MTKEPSKRRARGTGTIFRDERRGVWVGRIPIGRNKNGTTRYLTRTAPTQKGVIAALAQAGPPGPETTVSQWCDRWLEQLDVRPGSHDSYDQTVRLRIKPTLGHIKVRDLAPHQVENAVRQWVTGISANTALTSLAHLHACMEAAVRVDLIHRNPTKAAKKPKRTKKPIDSFTQGELQKIITAATAVPEMRIIAVIAAVGCRSGEAMGLDVGDWNATAQTIAITKTQQRLGRGTGPPKSKRSTRTIRVPKLAVAAVVAAIGTRKAGPLFPAPTGRRLTHTTLTGRWKKLARMAGVPYRNPHQLRHSVATLLVSSGVPLGDVAAYLGDTVATIVATYLHPSGADPANTLDTLLDAVR